ncbi:hypothetical protein GO755_26550 [Spirosoma sp. HMF4905]|uniref:Uncharacterized protein n=1 Tax=Spirosoma arboris TaxID=2682092 RepID=A0A7K1SII1_9BACT|nr:hypothetical protein [Spirosoma arboris]MVM33627.1 hypothetical protein [Spirosoma arboris]
MNNANRNLQTTGNQGIAKAQPKPERELMDSLKGTSALKLSEAKELSEESYMSLIALQESVTIEKAATASTVQQVIGFHGKPTVLKLVCAILKLFNDGLNTSLRMDARQLFEYALVWCGEFPNETVKDLILCLKRVKAGRYGPIFNRIDGTVVSDFFRKYLLEKAEWGEEQNRKFKSDMIQTGNSLLASLGQEKIKEIKLFIQRAKLHKTPEITTPISSDKNFAKYLAENAEDIEFEILEDLERRSKAQNIPDVLAIVETEKARRNQVEEPVD